MRRALFAMSLTLFFAACQGPSGVQSGAGLPPLGRNAGSGSLGPVLSTSGGGQIFGFDVDRIGNDGVLAAASSSEISVQTFNATTGKITKTLGVKTGHPVTKGDDYVADGIFAGDVALLNFERAGKPGVTPAHDRYYVMDPASGKKFTGKWNPSIKLFHIMQSAVNQDTPTSV